MLENKKAVLFDLDGTLIDSMGIWGKVDIEYLGKRGYKVPAGLSKEIEGMGFTETAQYFKEHFDLPDSIEQMKEEWLKLAYNSYAKTIPLKKGVKNFLTLLKKSQIPFAITTSTNIQLARASVSLHRLQDDFAFILTSCDVNRGKPYPDIYLEAARKLQVKPEECLVFEDVPKGIKAGKEAGMQVCAVFDSHALPQLDVVRTLADYYITDFDEIIEGTYEVLNHES